MARVTVSTLSTPTAPLEIVGCHLSATSMSFVLV
jgi:hypothetical protein